MDNMEEKDKNQQENPENENYIGDNGNGNGEPMHRITHLSGMYKDWFLDYASYVILERAVQIGRAHV